MNNIIYICKCPCNKYYIGSTDSSLLSRINQHSSSYKNINQPDYNTKKGIHWRNCINNFEELIFYILDEDLNEDELIKNEDYWVRHYDTVNNGLNSQYPIRNNDDYKKQLKNARNKYRSKNREYLNKRSNEYYYDNKEMISVKQRDYHKKMEKKLKEKFNCECGGKYTTAGIAVHKKTKRHKEYFNI